MVALDPEEERLLAEAIFETADEDLSGPVMEIVEDVSGEKDGDNVPKSKVQFPIRRSKYSRKRKVFCAMTLLIVLVGAILLTYFLLRAKTFSFELSLSEGQILHYKLTQEHTFEALKTVHANFAEDVFVQIVNKTGKQCWMKVFLESLPQLQDGPYAFLVRVNLGGQNSVDIDDEKRLKVLTPWKKNNTLDYYVLNLLTQLLPVVKIDLFEIILSQITTRKHEVVLEDSKFFQGDATMKQNIRMAKDEIWITSKIEPEGFSSFASNSNKQLPHILFNFEEDTSISKTTGMITKSDMELSVKLPIAGDGKMSSQAELSMHFKSSLRLADEQKNVPDINKRQYTFRDISELATPSHDGLMYYGPSVKKYDETTNMVETIKEMLNMTIPHNTGPTKSKTNKDMEAFARSFHKITQPGIETHFEELMEKRKERFPDRHKTSSTTPVPTTTEHRQMDDYNHDDDGNDDDYNTGNEPLSDDYDDDDARQSDNGYGRGGLYRFGQPIPMFPDDDEDDDDNDDSNETGEDVGHAKDPPNEAQKGLHKDDAEKKDFKSTGQTREGKKLNNEVRGGSHTKEKLPKSLQNSKAEKLTSAALYKEGKKLMAKKGKHKSQTFHHKGEKSKKSKAENTPKTSTIPKNKKDETGKIVNENGGNGKTANKNNDIDKTMKTPAPQLEEKNLFDRIFDELWKGDSSQSEQPENAPDDGGFKFSNLIPSFSFSSDFPFIHLKWDKSDSRKKRSLESTVRRKRRDIKIHRDKRRMFDDDETSYYTSRDLEPIWDIVSMATIKEHAKQTSQVFQHKIMGLDVNSELEHEVKVHHNASGTNSEGWGIHISLLLSVDKHKFRVLNKVISMKEIEERFLRNAKPKFEYGTVHAGTLVSVDLQLMIVMNTLD